MYVCNEIYVYEKDTSEIISLAEGKLDKNLIMWCDSAEPDRIQMWKRAGYYRAQGVTKTPFQQAKPMAGANKKSYINSQIDWLKQRKIYIHPSCVNTIKEIQQWKWKKDKETNQYIDEPVDIFDDAMAALRYGCTSQMQQRTSILEVL